MTGILHKRPDVVTIMTIQMPNKKEGNRIIRIIRARIQDPRSKIAQRFCAGNLGSNAQPNHPNHFRIILIRARPWIQDPRLPRGLARESWIQRVSVGSKIPWQDPWAILDLGSWIQGRARIKMIRMIRLSIGSKIARARPVGNLGSWILDPGPGPNQNDSEMIRMIRGYFAGNPPNMKE